MGVEKEQSGEDTFNEIRDLSRIWESAPDVKPLFSTYESESLRGLKPLVSFSAESVALRLRDAVKDAVASAFPSNRELPFPLGWCLSLNLRLLDGTMFPLSITPHSGEEAARAKRELLAMRAEEEEQFLKDLAPQTMASGLPFVPTPRVTKNKTEQERGRLDYLRGIVSDEKYLADRAPAANAFVLRMALALDSKAHVTKEVHE